jgi:DNA-binding transcriptional LysR family regulator
MGFIQVMQVECLKVFCDLAETHSFTRAAQINEVTQSAVSQLVATLEKNLKGLLLQRARGESKLTPKGEMVYEHSKEIVGLLDELQAKLKETQEQVSGTIRLATIYSVGLYDLPSSIKRFLKGFPHASIHIEYRHAHEIYEQVLGNVVDLGLVDYAVRQRNLQVVFLREDPLVLICGHEHPLAKRKSVKLKTLNGQKIIGFDSKIPIRKSLDSTFRKQHVAVQYSMEFDTVENVKRAVENYNGLGIVPESTIRQEVANQTLVVVRLEDARLSRPLAAIHTRTRVLSPAMKELITLLKGPV